MSIRVAYFMQDTGAIYGAERATLDLVAGLQASGEVEPRIYLIEETRLDLKESAVQQAWRNAGVSVVALPVDHAFSPRLIRCLRQQLADDGIQVLHTTGYKADVHGVWAAKIPIVSTVHGWLFRPDWKEQAYGAINLWALRRMSAVVALSTYYRDYLEERDVAARYIPTGFVAPEILPERPPATPLRVGMVGRLSWEKNHPMLIRAAALLRERQVPVTFRIFGDGPDSAAIVDAIASQQLQDQMQLLPYQPIDSIFDQIDVLAMCSWMENLPYVLLESMAAGVPMVATGVGGIPDLIEDGVSGRLVEPDDEQGLADVLQAWAEQPGVLSLLRVAARQRLQREFHPHRMCAEHVQLYQSVIA
jgi:glycosyltransferase involved in cell wall biosynthesis